MQQPTLTVSSVVNLAELFMSLQTPSSWPRLAEYLRSQKDLVNAKGDEAEVLAINTVLRAFEALRKGRNLERHELKRYWDTNF
jgi:hypothetical protein